MRFSPVLPLWALVCAALVAGCGSHQYVAIPGATAVEEDIALPVIGMQPPVVTVPQGSSHLVVGQSTTLHIDFGVVTDMTVTQLLIYGPDFDGHWLWELTPEEVLAGSLDLDFQVLDAEPESTSCRRGNHGSGTCYQEADSGVSALFATTANDSGTGYGARIPVVVDPLSGESQSSTCDSFTKEDCCAGSQGISAVACYVAPPCGCPTGTDGNGVQGDGTTMCLCPGA